MVVTGEYNLRFRAEGGVCDTGRNVSQGDVITLISSKGSWRFVNVGGGFEAWVHRGALSPASVENPRREVEVVTNPEPELVPFEEGG